MDYTPTYDQHNRFNKLISELEGIKEDLNSFNREHKTKHGTSHFKAYNLSSEIYQKIQDYKAEFSRKFSNKEEVINKLSNSVKYYQELAKRVKDDKPIIAL